MSSDSTRDGTNTGNRTNGEDWGNQSTDHPNDSCNYKDIWNVKYNFNNNNDNNEKTTPV